MSSIQDQARVIADRVARRLAVESPADERETSRPRNGAAGSSPDGPRARIINFVSPAPPPHTQPSIGGATITKTESVEPPREVAPQIEATFHSQVAQSPWLVPFSHANDEDARFANGSTNQVAHPSQERFGVDEAAVSELVEFFENEKKCSIDPSGKPCDHCAMCSGRGF